MFKRFLFYITLILLFSIIPIILYYAQTHDIYQAYFRPSENELLDLGVENIVLPKVEEFQFNLSSYIDNPYYRHFERYKSVYESKRGASVKINQPYRDPFIDPRCVSLNNRGPIKVHFDSDPWINFDMSHCSCNCQMTPDKSSADIIIGDFKFVRGPIVKTNPSQLTVGFFIESPEWFRDGFDIFNDLGKSVNWTTSWHPKSDFMIFYPFPGISELKIKPNKGDNMIAFQSSNCKKVKRTEYARMLNELLPVKNLGKCLQNVFVSETKKRQILVKSRFMFVMENSYEPFYHTEKFFQAYSIGAIPVYGASDTYKYLVPGKNSLIYVDDFDSPADLAKHILHLDSHPEEYDKYFEWKSEPVNPLYHYYRRMQYFSLVCRVCDRYIQELNLS